MLRPGMGAATLVSVEDYLSTSYSPDREYLDGWIVERNLGEKTHSTIQRNLIFCFTTRRKELGVEAYPEQRVQVSPTRFLLCIEILSTDDTMVYMQEKLTTTCNSEFPTSGSSILACAKATWPPRPALWKPNPGCWKRAIQRSGCRSASFLTSTKVTPVPSLC